MEEMDKGGLVDLEVGSGWKQVRVEEVGLGWKWRSGWMRWDGGGWWAEMEEVEMETGLG